MPVRPLKDYPFFADLKAEYLALITRHADTDLFKPGEYLFRENEHADKFFIVSQGKVNVEVQVQGSHPFSIQTLNPGDILGWSWFIPPYQWRFSAKALDKTEVVVIDGKALQEACEQNHDLGYEIYKRLAGIFVQRLEATRQQLLQVYSNS